MSRSYPVPSRGAVRCTQHWIQIYGVLGVSCIMCWYVFGRRAFPLLLDEQACPAHSLITKVLSQPFSTASDAKHPLPNKSNQPSHERVKAVSYCPDFLT